jgi:hypothetical protein
MDEKETPDEAATTLINYLNDYELLNGDKLTVPVEEIEVPNMDEGTKEKAFDKLFAVSVSMVDEGEETDCYFIHT